MSSCCKRPAIGLALLAAASFFVCALLLSVEHNGYRLPDSKHNVDGSSYSFKGFAKKPAHDGSRSSLIKAVKPHFTSKNRKPHQLVDVGDEIAFHAASDSIAKAPDLVGRRSEAVHNQASAQKVTDPNMHDITATKEFIEASGVQEADMLKSVGASTPPVLRPVPMTGSDLEALMNGSWRLTWESVRAPLRYPGAQVLSESSPLLVVFKVSQGILCFVLPLTPETPTLGRRRTMHA